MKLFSWIHGNNKLKTASHSDIKVSTAGHSASFAACKRYTDKDDLDKEKQASKILPEKKQIDERGLYCLSGNCSNVDDPFEDEFEMYRKRISVVFSHEQFGLLAIGTFGFDSPEGEPAIESLNVKHMGVHSDNLQLIKVEQLEETIDDVFGPASTRTDIWSDGTTCFTSLVHQEYRSKNSTLNSTTNSVALTRERSCAGAADSTFSVKKLGKLAKVVGWLHAGENKVHPSHFISSTDPAGRSSSTVHELAAAAANSHSKKGLGYIILKHCKPLTSCYGKGPKSVDLPSCKKSASIKQDNSAAAPRSMTSLSWLKTLLTSDKQLSSAALIFTDRDSSRAHDRTSTAKVPSIHTHRRFSSGENGILSSINSKYLPDSCEDTRVVDSDSGDPQTWAASTSDLQQQHLSTLCNNVKITGQRGLPNFEKSYENWIKTEEEGVMPNIETFCSMFKACAKVGALKAGKEIHAEMIRRGLQSKVLATNLILMYGRCGSMVDAHAVFDKLPDKDVQIWSALIGGHARNGESELALQYFDRMEKSGFTPEGVTYLCVLRACSHAGLVEKGLNYFDSMTKHHGITPTVEHYGCKVDLLGRAGCLNDAEKVLLGMPMAPDLTMWNTLLAACRKFGNFEIGRRAFDIAQKQSPQTPGLYVTMSNIYAAANMWDKVEEIRKMQIDGQIQKVPGRSWIEVDGKVHTFQVDDKTHPKTLEINAELRKLFVKIKDAGYVPHLDSVLLEIDDRRKEAALWGHSEKLAIAFGLISTSSSEPIIVMKNLRVCTDCHNASAIISKVTARRISLRDASRFHHFVDGKCSCGGYW